MNTFPTHYMIDSPCYFCGKMMPVFAGIDHLTCSKHREGNVWIVHHYDKKTLELSKVYFNIKRGNDLYGFSLYPKSQTMTICYMPTKLLTPSRMKDILELTSIPQNLTPENAQDKLSFYLTYL